MNGFRKVFGDKLEYDQSSDYDQSNAKEGVVEINKCST